MKTCRLKLLSLLTVGAMISNTCLAQFGGFNFGLPGGAGTLITIIAVAIIAKHEADERQKKIAQERARLSYERMSAKKKAALKAKKVRYIAVDTEKNGKTSKGAKKSVMVWDTQSKTMANTSVYDVKEAPQKGSTAKFDNYSAEYVGSGT